MNVSISQSAASPTAQKQFAPLGLGYGMELGDTSISDPFSEITTRPEFELALILQENSQPCKGSQRK
jgi:hypothetical protein